MSEIDVLNDALKRRALRIDLADCYEIEECHVEAIEKALTPRWIPTSERLPPEREGVLAYVIGVRFIGWRIGNEWFFVDGTIPVETVTHWMPLPDPPK